MHKKYYEKDPYNDHQNFLYNRALHGLSAYSPKEINEMPLDKKKRVTKVTKKVQKVLNLWKQEIANRLANKFFTDVFPDTEFTKSLIEIYGVEGDPEYFNTMSFKMLKITKKDIINKLIKERLLPKNFLELKDISKTKKPKAINKVKDNVQTKVGNNDSKKKEEV